MTRDKEKSREEILERLRKLNAMAESAADIGNEAEAQAFAAKVQELLTAYKLSQADIRTGEVKPDEPINITYVSWKDLGMEVRKVRIAWAEQLGGLVAQPYYCNFVICGWGGHIGMFVGAETDRKIAVYMFITLARFFQTLVEREYAVAWRRATSQGDVTTCRGFKAGFTYGFLSRLSQRFDEELKPKVDQPVSNSLAIVAVRKDSLAKVKQWKHEHLDTKPISSTHLSDGSGEGRARGKAAADKLDLNKKSIEHPGREAKQLS